MTYRRIGTMGVEPTRSERIRIAVDRAMARNFLARYSGAKRQLDQLRARRRQILIEMRSPVAGVTRYVPVPVGGGGTSDPTAAPTIHLSEIEEQINRQIRAAEDLCEKTMAVLSVLPLFSRERQALELRYIDGADIRQMQEHLYCSRSLVFKAMNDGLDMLMADERAQALILQDGGGKR